MARVRTICVVEISVEPPLAKLVSCLVLDEEGNEILDGSVGQRFDLRVHDPGYGFGLGRLALLVDQIVLQPSLQDLQAGIVLVLFGHTGTITPGGYESVNSRPANSTMNLRRGAA
jgi:hypothetical protein